MKNFHKPQKLKKIIINMMSFLVLFQGTAAAYADPVVVKPEKTVKLSQTPSKEKKVKGLKSDDPTFNPATNTLSNSSPGSSVSGTDLSSNYNIGIISTNLYPEQANLNITYSLNASYHSSNTSDEWGAGTGISLNIPKLGFGEWIKVCNGGFSTNKPGECNVSSDTNIATQRMEDFPKYITFSGMAGAGTFKQERSLSSNTMIYEPVLLSSSNSTVRIKATKGDNYQYTFEVDTLNNRNSYLKFSFNAESSSNIKNPSNGELVAIRSEMYKNSLLPTKIDYINPSDLTKGILIYGSERGEKEHNIRLNNIYPNFELLTQRINTEYTNTDVSGCFVTSLDKMPIPLSYNSIDNAALYSSLPSNVTYKTAMNSEKVTYDNCPTLMFDLTDSNNYKSYITTQGNIGTESKASISGINLIDKLINVELILDPYAQLINNLLYDSGTGQNYVGGIYDSDQFSIKVDTKLSYVAQGKATALVYGHKLSIVKWEDSDNNSLQAINLTYDTAGVPANHMTNVDNSYYGLSSNNRAVPLLTKVDGWSSISPVPTVSYKYVDSPYNTFYGIETLIALGNEDSLTDVLYANKSKLTKAEDPGQLKFKHVSSMIVSDSAGNSTTTNYSWGKDNHNINQMIDTLAKVSVSESDVAYKNSVIRGSSNFYATTESTTGLTTDKLKDASYTTLVNNGQTLTLTKYNRYGLPVQTSSCPSDTLETDLSNCDITKLYYETGGVVDKNDNLTTDLTRPYDLIGSAEFYHGDKKLYSISNVYDGSSFALPQKIVYYDGRGALSAVLNMTYDKDSDGYFKIEKKEQYSRPFINENINNPSSKSFTVTKYNYATKNQEGHDYTTLSSVATNISNAKSSKTLYDYDNLMRLTDTTTCINPKSGDDPQDCRVNKSADRYTSSSKVIYNSDNITTKTSSTGSGQVTYYIPGTNMVAKQIGANGTQVVYKYDGYGRLTDSTTSILSNNTEDPLAINNNHVEYSAVKDDKGNINATTVTTTDTYGNKMLSHYNGLGQLDCTLVPNSSIDLDYTPVSGYSHEVTTYKYNTQGQVSSTALYSLNQAPTSCDATGGILLSKIDKTYDYKGRVLDSITTVPEFNNGEKDNDGEHYDRKEFHTKTHYEYTYSAPSTGFWSYLRSFFNGAPEDIMTTTKEENSIQYPGATDWEFLGSTTVSTDVFNHSSQVSSQLPHEKPIITSSSEVSYNSDPNSETVLSVHSTGFGSPDSNIEYDKLGKVLNQQVISKDKQLSESMGYVYDDLDRVVGVTANGKKLPYSLHYDDDGLISQQIYNYKDGSTAKSRLTDYNESDVCLAGNTLCMDNAFQYKQLKQINIYSDATSNGLDTNKPFKGAGEVIQSQGYSYDNYGLNDSQTNHSKAGDIIYNTVRDKKNHMRTSHIERKDASGVTSVDYSYYTNGSLYQQIINQSNGKSMTKTFSNNSNDYKNIVQSVRLTSSTPKGSVDDAPVDFQSSSFVDPGTGAIIKTIFKDHQNLYGGRFDYMTQYFYDSKLRLNRKLTNSDNSAGIYQDTVYNYCDGDSNNCLYDDLTGVTNFNSKDRKSFVGESYVYDKKSNQIASRSLIYQTPDIQGAGNIENYKYDGLDRLHDYQCNPLGHDPDNSMCSSDNLSGGSPIQHRVYEYDNNNNIASVTTQAGGKTYAYEYHYDENNNQLLSVEDVNTKSALFSLSYDPVMGWVKSFQQGSSVTPDNFRNIDYSYDTDGLLSSVTSKDASGAEKPKEKINISRGIQGINKINYPGNNERQYFGGGLYKQTRGSSTTTTLGVGDSSSPDYLLAIKRTNNQGNEIDEVFKGLNDRVLATGGHGGGSEALFLNSYTPYGQFSTKFFDGDSQPSIDKSRALVYGDNGALTISGSTDSKTGGSKAEQYQILGSRIYMPQIGRFLEQDSASPFGGGGPNAYMYSPANPIGFADPSGHFGSIFSNGQSNSFNSVGDYVDPAKEIFEILQLIVAIATLPLTFEISEVSLPVAIGGFVAGGLAVASASVTLAGTANHDSNLLSIGGYLGWASLGAGIATGGLSMVTKGLSSVGTAATEIGEEELEKAAPIVAETAEDSCPGGQCAAGSSACFTESTTVVSIDTHGNKKPIKIKDIKLGNIVATSNTESKESGVNKSGK